MHAFRSHWAVAMAAGVLFSALMAVPVVAEPWDQVPSMDVVRNRLDLSPEQEAKLTPLFRDRATQLQELRTRVEQAPSRQEKRTVLRDAKKQADAFNSEVESLLDTSQKQEWREIRAQTREKLQQAVKEQRAGS
jgi:hypothetical protein